MGSRIIEAVAGLHGLLLLAAAFGLAFGEAAMFLDLLVPGEVGMVVTGAAVAEKDLALWPLALAGAGGAFAGDSFSYWMGRGVTRRLVERWAWLADRLDGALTRARRSIDEGGGGRAVFVARWVGALRAVVPMAAGTAGMPYRRFVAYDLPACVLWGAAMTTLGYLFGDSVAGVVDRVGVAGSAVAVAGIAAVWLVRRHRQRRR